MLKRFLALIAISFFLTGCLSVPPHTLSDSQLQQYKITDISLEGIEVIRSWPTEEDRYLQSHQLAPEQINRIQTEPAFNFPELKAHFQQALEARVRSEIGYLIGPILSGHRPVRVVVRLKIFDIPSAARRVFVDNNAKIQADIDLVDKTTGQLILRYDGRPVVRQLIGGLGTGIALIFESPDLGYSMMSDYLSAYRNWLLHN